MTQRSLFVPTSIVSILLFAFPLGMLLSDPRSTFENGAYLSQIFGLDIFSPRASSVILLSIASCFLPYLVHAAVSLTYLSKHRDSKYNSHTAALHPVSAFLFLWELTFTSSNEHGMRRYALLTRLLLVYLLLLMILALELSLPYRNAA